MPKCRDMLSDTALHYDMLTEQNNDPVRDPEQLKKYMDRWDGEPFMDMLRLAADKRVLEIGVGTGRLAMKTAPLCRELYGIDISPKSLERAKENLAAHKNITYICGDYLEYDFEHTFDTVYSSLTFMHIEDKARAVCKAAALLADGGVFVLSIDKNREEFLDFEERRLKIFPDTPENIAFCIAEAGLYLTERRETEFAHIFAAKKHSNPYIASRKSRISPIAPSKV